MGNLDDITYRAVRVLKEVDLIAAEDTRHTRLLLDRYAIVTAMLAFHEHNEQARTPQLLDKLHAGLSIAMVSDAGTPLISDPGYPLIREARAQDIKVVPIPGPCASICALSAAGMPTDRFLFVGFPPRQAGQRQRWLRNLKQTEATLVFYESSHRLLATLSDMSEVFGASREMVIARELTKLHETFLYGTVGELFQCITQEPDQRRGEFVLLIQGVEPEPAEQISLEIEKLLQVLGTQMPIKQAVNLAIKLTGRKKNDLYQKILKIKNKMG
jgi:16S rRNA (cytidine1402-2'-O)-methyltransferase